MVGLPPDARVFLGRLTHLDPHAVVRLRSAGGGPRRGPSPGSEAPYSPRGRYPAPEPAGRSAAPDQAAAGPATPTRTALWGRVPWGVLVTREVEITGAEDVTVGAAALLESTGPLPPARDQEWRWPLPPHPGEVVEQIPAGQLAEVAAAAAGTLREVRATGLDGRPVGVRVLREALLDHVPIVVESAAVGESVVERAAAAQADAGRLEVPQRLVQAVVRMGFLGSADTPVQVRLANRWVGLAAQYGTGWLPPPAGPLTIQPVRSAS